MLVGALALAPATANAASFVIDGLDGPPTANELASLKAGLKIDPNTKVITCDASPCGPYNVFIANHHNNYVYGETGGATEGMIALYSITKDQEIADSMVFFADQMLAHRNDRYKTHTMYTGKAELCWPNKDPGDIDYGYCGTENGDVLGHITSVALEIVKSPMLWNKTTPVPDTLGFGKTYLDRARGYLTECRKTIDTFIIPQLVDPATNRFRYPDSAGFGALGPRYENLRGKTVPWNQNTMLANAFLSIAMSLEVLNEEPATVAKYDLIVKTWVRALIDVGVVKTTTMGNPTYDWCYGSADKPPKCSEDVGHGGYDFWGVYRAFARPKLGLTMAEVVPFANTFRFAIMLSGGGYAAKVNGTGTGGNVGSTWLYASFLRHDIFPSVAGALIPAAKKGDPDTAGRILWSKYMNSRSWQPEDSYGAGGTVPPPPDAGALPDAGGGGDDAGPEADAAPENGGAGGSGGTGGGSAGTGGHATGGSGGDGGSSPPAGGSGDSGDDTPPAKHASSGGCALGGGATGGWLALAALALIARRRRRG